MLTMVYEKSDAQCNIDICFRMSPDGRQENHCRSMLSRYALKPSMEHGRAIAERLYASTTRKSGLGLLFLLQGKEPGGVTKLVVSRFPADNAIAADTTNAGLTVEYLERVFMKKASSYKAVRYAARDPDTDYWQGRAVDRQINAGADPISGYWIRDFLDSDFRTTSIAGSRRLADALRSAIASAQDIETKEDLISFATLLRRGGGSVACIDEMLDRYTIGPVARGLIEAEIPAHLRREQFKLDTDEFQKHIPRRSITLHTGAQISTPTKAFGDLIKQESLGDGQVRFSTTGRPVDLRLGRGGK